MKNGFFEIRLAFINRVIKDGWDKALQEFKKNFAISETQAKRWWKWYEEKICIPEVCYETDSSPQILKGEKGKGQRIEELPLIVQGPLKVEFAGKTYHIEQEGLYRFAIITRSLRNLIMVRAKDSVMPILKALSFLHIHGNRDAFFSLEERKKLVLSRYWISLTCGDIAILTSEILSDAGFKSRLVSALTLEEWNTYNNGHALLEVYFPSVSKWVLVDIDMGYVFLDENKLIDSITFWRFVKQNKQPVFVPLSPKEVDPLWLENNNYSYAHMWRSVVKDIPSKWDWYKRIFQTFGFKDKEKWVYLAEGKDAKRVFEYRGHYSAILPEKRFEAKFYT